MSEIITERGEPPPGDAVLVARARAGDRAAVDALVARYLADVHGVAFRILEDPHLAEDAAQDAFLNALTGLEQFRGDSSFRTWLLRIAGNAARTIGRRHGRRREVPMALAVEVADDSPDSLAMAAVAADVGRLTDALARLPSKQRLVVSLRAIHGLSHREVAAAADCSEGAARVNYHLGIKRLRELMR